MYTKERMGSIEEFDTKGSSVRTNLEWGERTREKGGVLAMSKGAHMVSSLGGNQGGARKDKHKGFTNALPLKSPQRHFKGT